MKIAFVVQRYGLEVNGGAEYLCRMIAEKLSKHFEIEVITTCALDFITWDNCYPEGKSTVNGITVWRFPTDRPRNISEFNRFSEKILQMPHSLEDEIQWMKLQGPYSTKLIEFIKKQRDNFDFFIFFTYLYCTTYFGLPLVKDKAILVPTAHDELPIYLEIYRDLFRTPRAIIYNTEEERKLVNSIFDNSKIPSDVVGVGVEPCSKGSRNNFRSKYQIQDKFIIYVGRIDEKKGCKELCEYFQKFIGETKANIKLLFVGRAVMKIPKCKSIIALGFISETDKYNAISSSELFVMPSKYESLSIVLLEAWECGVPVLVNGKCEVLKAHCIKSNGGLWYENYEEFKECMKLLIGNKKLRNKLGENGMMYTNKKYDWRSIENRYLKLLHKLNKNL